MKSALCLLVAGLMMSACTTVPPTNVHQPMTARPAPRSESLPASGSIYQAGASRTLFEDRRARYVGDTMTISISENTSASTKSNTSVSRSTSTSASVPTLTGLPGKSLQGIGLEASSANSLAGKGDAAANNVFTGTITVTVIEVLPNGNLLVSGEKQIAINQGNEFIRFSGIVNPVSVTGANTVQSTQVADARIEYRANGYIDETQQMGWLQRFFVNVLPF